MTLTTTKAKARRPGVYLQNVKKWIEFSNDLPLDFDAITWSDYVRSLSLNDRANLESGKDQHFQAWLAKYREFPAFTFGVRLPSKPINQMIQDLNERIDTRNLVNGLIEFSEAYRRSGRLLQDKGLIFPSEFRVSGYFMVDNKTATENNKHLLDFQVRDFHVEHLRGIDVRRLRRCPIDNCRKAFYAARLDQIGCSSKHNALARQWRKRVPAERAELKKLYRRLESKLKGAGIKGWRGGIASAESLERIIEGLAQDHETTVIRRLQQKVEKQESKVLKMQRAEILEK